MSVSKEVEKQEPSRVAVKVVISGDQTAAAYQESLAKFKSKAELKGFRKGKVPASVLENKFGKFIREESKANLLNDTVSKLWEEDSSIAPLEQAKQELDAEGDFVPGEDFAFSIAYDVMPEVEIPDFSSYVIASPRVKIAEEDVDQELKDIQWRNALVIDTHAPAVEGDAVVLEVEVPCEGHHHHHEEDHAHGQQVQVRAGSEDDASGLGKKVLGMSVGHVFEVLGEEAAALCSLLEIDGQDRLSVKCEKVQRYDLPAIDDELAQDVSEEYGSLEDLKNSIRKELHEGAQRLINKVRLRAFFREWLEKGDMVLPETLEKQAEARTLEKLWTETLEKYGSPQAPDFDREWQRVSAEAGEDFNNVFEDFRKQIRLDVLRGAVAKAEDIKVEEDTLAEIVERATQRAYQCSFQQVSEWLGAKEAASLWKRAENKLLADKVDEFLLNAVGDKEGEEVGLNQLREMAGMRSTESAPSST